MPIQSLHRAIDILSLFSSDRPRLGLTEISNFLGLSKPTVHGLVSTLVNRGFMQQDPENRKYMLGFGIYELGTILSGTLRINQVAANPAHQLAKDTRTTGRIAIFDNDSVLVTLTVHAEYESIFFNPPGPRVPLYCSSLGKAVLCALDRGEIQAYMERTVLMPRTPFTVTDGRRLLQELEEARRRGYSTDREEYLIGLTCIGAPIHGSDGRPFAALSLSGRKEILSGEQEGEIADKLIKTATDISRAMGHLSRSI